MLLNTNNENLYGHHWKSDVISNHVNDIERWMRYTLGNFGPGKKHYGRNKDVHQLTANTARKPSTLSS